MTHPTEDLSSHAPLLDRLRGRAFLPGISYALQAGAWMGEAAAEIERLRGALEKERQRYESLADLKAKRGKNEAAEEFWAKAEAIAEVLKS